MKNLKIIAAVGKNMELGYRNDLIWKIKEDLQFFKKQTMGNYIIMGKNTYESLPKQLAGRKYIVLTSDEHLHKNDKLLTFRTIRDVLEFVKKNKDSQFFVIGGGQIYKSFLPYVNAMYLTEINDTFKNADTFFPAFDKNQWIKQNIQVFEENKITYKRILYLRKKTK